MLGFEHVVHGVARGSAVGGVALVVGAIACGASPNAVYEGDVRFEHCMALDSQPDVRPIIRRACWQEWQKFYTFGQTRDRVEHARSRVAQLNGQPTESDERFAPITPLAVPEPTSALAPPPMMLSAQPPTTAPPEASAPPPATAPTTGTQAAPPGAACGKECEEAWTLCQGDCAEETKEQHGACLEACERKHVRCMRRCF